VYKEYYKMKRRERYIEEDIKVGRIAVDPETETVEYIPSKEDSINRLMDLGDDFQDDQMIEDILCDKATLLILQEAMAELNEKEQELIQALYYKDLTIREVNKYGYMYYLKISLFYNIIKSDIAFVFQVNLVW